MNWMLLVPNQAAIATPLRGPFQLPLGSFNRDEAGTYPPDRDHEIGYLHRDRYGAPFRFCRGAALPILPGFAGSINERILDFIRLNYPNLRVVAYWH